MNGFLTHQVNDDDDNNNYTAAAVHNIMIIR